MKQLLLFVGGQYHDFTANGALLKETLEATGRFRVSVSDDPKSLLDPGKFSATVIYAQAERIPVRQQKVLAEYVKSGGAVVGLHLANVPSENSQLFQDLLGSRFTGHGPVHEFEVTIDKPDHDIALRVPSFKVTDELYSIELQGEAEVFASAFWQGKNEPMGYTKRYGTGTVVYLANGHDARSLKRPFFQKLLVRSVDHAVGRRETGEVRCGIIGYGGAFNMGKLHGDSINSTHGMRVVAVCDLSIDRTEQAKVDFPEAEVFNRVEDLLRKPDLDLCVIITPHNTHAPVALKCLRAGKSVVSEKPFCLSVKEADAMIAAAKESKVTLSVYHNRRYDGDYMALKEILQSGILGEVFKVEANFGGYGKPGTWWRSDKKISGGAFYDWGAHFVDWVLNLVPQPIDSVSGYFFNKMQWHHVSNEDHCEAIVKFKNGTVATLQTSALAAVGAPRWRILGTLGAVIDDRAVENHFTVVSHQSGEGVRMHIPYKSGRWDRYYPALADHLLRGEELVVKPEEARRVIAVIEYAERSAKSGKPERIPGEA